MQAICVLCEIDQPVCMSCKYMAKAPLGKRDGKSRKKVQKKEHGREKGTKSTRLMSQRTIQTSTEHKIP